MTAIIGVPRWAAIAMTWVGRFVAPELPITTASAARAAAGEGVKSARTEIWLRG